MARALLPALLSSLMLTGAVSTAAPTNDEPPAFPQVAYDAGYLSVRADDIPREVLLATVAAAIGAEIHGTVLDPRPITITFDGVPLSQGIERLVGDQNFTMRYAADGSPRRITLRSNPGTPPGAARRGTPARREDALASFLTALARHPPIRVHGNLAVQLGGDQAPLTDVLRSLRGQQHRAMLQQAMRRFLRAVERDPALRRGLAQLLPEELNDFARRNAGNRSTELLRFLATNARRAGARARDRRGEDSDRPAAQVRPARLRTACAR